MYDLTDGLTVQGPLTGEQIKSLAKTGQLKETAKVRCHPHGKWHSVLTVKKLSEFFNDTDPAVVRGAAIMDLHERTGKPLFECEQILRATVNTKPVDQKQAKINAEVAALHAMAAKNKPIEAIVSVPGAPVQVAPAPNTESTTGCLILSFLGIAAAIGLGWLLWPILVFLGGTAIVFLILYFFFSFLMGRSPGIVIGFLGGLLWGRR